MNPIGSSFSAAPAATPAGSNRPARAAVNTDRAEGTLPGERRSAKDAQQGIQRIRDAGKDEFRAYAPADARTTEKAAADPSRAVSGDISPPLPGSGNLEDPQLQQAVAQLKAIEEKVKAHEAAHKAAGGSMTGPISYSYTRGPDGRSYITGGEVPISVSPGKTPQETISRLQQAIRAALAPADPSPQDRAVAAQAAVELQRAQQQLSRAATPVNAETPAAQGEAPADERLPETENTASGLTIQASKAYGNSAAPSPPNPFQPAPSQSSSDITGFGRVQTISRYA